MRLPVVIRRFFGLHVNGPKPGFRRLHSTGWTSKPVEVKDIQPECTLSDINNLGKGRGILIPAQYWKMEYHNFNAAQAGIRDKHPTRAFSIRVARARGGVPDMLIIRTA